MKFAQQTRRDISQLHASGWPGERPKRESFGIMVEPAATGAFSVLPPAGGEASSSLPTRPGMPTILDSPHLMRMRRRLVAQKFYKCSVQEWGPVRTLVRAMSLQFLINHSGSPTQTKSGYISTTLGRSKYWLNTRSYRVTSHAKGDDCRARHLLETDSKALVAADQQSAEAAMPGITS